MIQKSTKPIYQEIKRCINLQKRTKGLENKLALANYIEGLYGMLQALGVENVHYRLYDLYGGESSYYKIVNLLNDYRDLFFHNYLENREFHQQYFAEILPDIQDLLSTYESMDDIQDSIVSEKDFQEIVFSFLSQYGLDHLLIKYDKENRIFSSKDGQMKRQDGFTAYNCLTGKSFLCLKQFQHDFFSMSTLIHELGHGYDFQMLPNSAVTYNGYFYSSLYAEVFSITLERLFYRYCLKNHIQEDVAKARLLDFEDGHYEYLTWAYIISLLDDEFLEKDRNLNSEPKVIASRVKEYFTDEKELESLIESCPNFNVHDVNLYAYGDILSMFLADDMEQNGFHSELMDYFMQNRMKLFHEEFLRECGFGPVNYMQLYEKEFQLMKK